MKQSYDSLKFPQKKWHDTINLSSKDQRAIVLLYMENQWLFLLTLMTDIKDHAENGVGQIKLKAINGYT